MMGEVSAQGNLFAGDHLHLEFVGEDSFYGWLALEGPSVFPDAAFSRLYVLDNGRPSVPPSQMMRLVLLQWHDKVSDEEAIARSQYDLRWKTGLGLEDHQRLCGKATLQTFRARLLLNEAGAALLAYSVRVCQQAGALSSPKIRAAIDTSPILGRGAVKDTYNLVADGMAKFLRILAAFESPLLGPGVEVEEFARRHDLSRYVTGTSLKGGAELDWDDEAARRAFLSELVTDVRRALALGRGLLAQAAAGEWMMRAANEAQVGEAMALLEQLVVQDIEVNEAGDASLRQGTAKDRVVSAHDPEMRHGRKSKRSRFEGHKGELVVDAETGVILGVAIKAGNAHDAAGSLEAIEQAEQTLKAAWKGASGQDEAEIMETLGDCAYGSGQNRREFAQAGRALTAKQPALHNGGRYTKEDFVRDEATGARTCPFGHCVLPRMRTRAWRGERVPVAHYEWPADVCAGCPLRQHCLKACASEDAPPPTRGRTLTEHPEEELLAQARAQQRTHEFREVYLLRQTAEHRLARVMQLGARQARYVGRAKTKLQWQIAAAVANLTLALGFRNHLETAEHPDGSPQDPSTALQDLCIALTIASQRRIRAIKAYPEPATQDCLMAA